MKKIKQNMNSKNKGFTLVELIAVIVIISVISIMSFASMTKTIKNSQIKEIEVFETNLKTAAQIYIETNLKDFPQLDNVGGSVQVATLSLISKGYLDKDIDNPSDCSLKDSYVLAEKQSDNTIEYTVSCVGYVQPTYTVYSNGTAIYFDPVAGAKCDAASAVSTTGTKAGCMKWYAFNDSSENDSVNLILDHNTTVAVVWNSTADNTAGPTNLLTQLKLDTVGWNGVPTRTDSYSVDNDTASYTINYSTYKARIISANEVAKITGNSDFNEATSSRSEWFYADSNNQTLTTTSQGTSNYAWLFDYTNGCTSYGCDINEASTYGYWTSTAIADNSSEVWDVYRNSNLGPTSANYLDVDCDGIRPVITILKSVVE